MHNDLTGMDIGQIRALASRLSREATEIESVMQRLTGRLTSARWQGDDRERFVSEWQRRHHVALQRVVEGLQQASAVATDYANRQEWASKS